MKNRLRHMVAAIAAAAILFSCGTLSAYADTPSVRHDDGSGNVYNSLPANYVHLQNIGLENAVIVSGGDKYQIIRGQLGKNAKDTRNILVYKGKLPAGFGTAKRTTTTDAVVKRNTMPAFTVKFANGAKLSDGTEADVVMEFGAWTLAVGCSYNDIIRDNTTVQVPVLHSMTGAKRLAFCATPPKDSFSNWQYTEEDHSSGAATAVRIPVTVRICEHEEGTAIGAPVSAETCPTMLVGFTDLDVRDETIRTSAGASAWYNGTYAEGIELISGWKSPVALAPLSGDGIENQCLVEAQSVNGNTKIKGSGQQYQKMYEATGAWDDTASYYSGLIAPASPQGFRFCWTGSVPGGKTSQGYMGTGIGGQPTVAVQAKRSAGGSLDKSYEGAWKSTTYIMNSATQYQYKPSAGYFVKDLKVDGVSQPLTEEERQSGGVYTFQRLNKYPLGTRNIRNGQILMATESGYYTIEAVFSRQPKYTVAKEADIESVQYGSEEPIQYTVTVEQTAADACAGTITLEDDLAGGLLQMDPESVTVSVDSGSYTINRADDTGISIAFDTPDASGSPQRLTLTYSAVVNWTAYEEGAIAGPIVNTVTDGETTAETSVMVWNDLTIAKEVHGDLRDETKQFELTVALAGLAPGAYYATASRGGELYLVTDGTRQGDGFVATDTGTASVVFKLKGGQSATVCELPVGCRYTVTEAESDHVASYELTSDAENPSFVAVAGANAKNWESLSTAEETLDAADGVVTVTFTNTRNGATRSGVPGHTDWIAGLLGVLAVTCCVLIAGRFITRRKRVK